MTVKSLKVETIQHTSALDVQVGGEHYKALGAYQPVEVLKRWLTEEEFRGYMKGTIIAYLARERQKNGDQDVLKAMHTGELFIELAGLSNHDSTGLHGSRDRVNNPQVKRGAKT